jgi:hypothetical protein
MTVRDWIAGAVVSLVVVVPAFPQAVPNSGDRAATPTWRAPVSDAAGPGAPRADASDAEASDTAAAGAAGQRPPEPRASEHRAPIARVTAGSGVLPSEHGQLWREYDITPYTARITSTSRPEQAIVDWILRETGYEVWHAEPLAILSATPQVLRVYHTPEMQKLVAEVVDRFVSSEAETHGFGLRVVSLSHPNWRARAQRLLQPVQVQTPGVQAWLLEKEDAAVVLAELRRRSDYREHSTPHLLVNNGQSTVVSATRGQSYVRNVSFRSEGWPTVEPEGAIIDEGFSLEFSPLLSVDGKMIDATIKCEIDQVEKMVAVPVEVSTAAAPRQRIEIQVPQTSQFRFHERFRWPVDKLLLVGMGMVALPVPSDGQTLVPGLKLPFGSGPPRADVLVFVESKGKIGPAPSSPQAGRAATAEVGRY